MWTFFNLPNIVFGIKILALLYHWLMWHMLNLILQAPLLLSSLLDVCALTLTRTHTFIRSSALWCWISGGGGLSCPRGYRAFLQAAFGVCLPAGWTLRPQDVGVVLRETDRWIGVYGWPQGLIRQQPGYRNIKSTWTCECGCSCSYFTPLESNQSQPPYI